MRTLIWIAALFALSGCRTLETIGETADLLAQFRPPTDFEAASPLPVDTQDRDRTVGEITVRYQGTHGEAPDFWAAFVARVVFQNTTSRTVESYEVAAPTTGVYRVEIVHDRSRPDNRDGTGITTIHSIVRIRDPQGKNVEVTLVESLSNDRYLRIAFPTRTTVQRYFNEIPRQGGWSDVLRSPTALVVYRGKRVEALLTQREPRQLLINKETPELPPWGPMSLVIADLLYRSNPED